MRIEIQEISMPFENFPQSFSPKVFPDKKIPDLLHLETSIVDIHRVDALLCALRANNISVILDLRREGDLDVEKAIEVVVLLRDWDQLSLKNILVLFGERFPEAFRKKLEVEAKIESKNFREWVIASQDGRIHQYPNLPWRSFIRKIVKENFDFILNCIQLWDSNVDEATFQRAFQEFLEIKKKVVCVFPKNWNH